MDYQGWNNLIASHFFNKKMAGKEVLLFVNKEELKDLGKSKRLTVNDFLRAIKEEALTTKGNICKRGLNYAVAERTDPRRMVTSSILVEGGDMPLVSIKTAEAIPKDKIDEALDAIQNTTVKAPVKIGDALIKNVAGTGVDIVATRNVYL